MLLQRTIKNKVAISGVGLHKGEAATVILRPLAANSGVYLSGESANFHKLHPSKIVHSPLCSTFKERNVHIKTIEHLLCALHVLGIDNISIEVIGGEVPILDGSAMPIVSAILDVGIEELAAPKNLIQVNESFTVEHNGSVVSVSPSDSLHVNCTIDFDSIVISQYKQKMLFSMGDSELLKVVLGSRTFGFEKDVEALQSQGLILGGSFDNAIVVGEYDVLNRHGLRNESEFVGHKVLDFIGDMYASGLSVIGSFDCYKPGHTINSLVMQKMFSEQLFDVVQVTGREPVALKGHVDSLNLQW
ncbi:UDP-3-O-acyl-N-acetylglucosamine deacetylase [Vibrio breoganii]